MRILVVGGGGREHALCWAISASPLCTKLYCAPGNAGIAQVAECRDVAAEDIAGQVALATREKIDFVVVGPEVPLAAGLADRIAEAGIKVFGPSAKAAQLESSKGFTKELCRRHNIPTGAYERFTDADKAVSYIKAQGAPIVVKADGLAAGKGVVVAASVAEAEDALTDFMARRKLGDAGAKALANAPHLASLAELSLWSNKIGDAGACALALERSPHQAIARNHARGEIRVGNEQHLGGRRIGGEHLAHNAVRRDHSHAALHAGHRSAVHQYYFRIRTRSSPDNGCGHRLRRRVRLKHKQRLGAIRSVQLVFQKHVFQLELVQVRLQTPVFPAGVV